jgi:hypothetical protein
VEPAGVSSFVKRTRNSYNFGCLGFALGGCHAANRVMGAFLVVVEHPPPGRLADIVQAREQVLDQNLLAEGPVEALDVGVLVRLAALEIPDGYALGICPNHECLAEKLRAVVSWLSS